jgi:uncharacterized protein involved in exopolysaccharide biosynthesis
VAGWGSLPRLAPAWPMSRRSTYIQIIQSPALIGEVVRELKLDQKPPKKETAGGTGFEQIYASIKALYDEMEP